MRVKSPCMNIPFLIDTIIYNYRVLSTFVFCIIFVANDRNLAIYIIYRLHDLRGAVSNLKRK